MCGISAKLRRSASKLYVKYDSNKSLEVLVLSLQSAEQKLSSAARVDYERAKSHLEKIGAPFFDDQIGRRVNGTKTVDITEEITSYFVNDLKLNRCRFYLKLEYENPLTDSVKGRAVASMVLKAIETGVMYGKSSQKKKWIEPTSGNTGKGLAEISNLLGIQFTAVLSRLDVSQSIRNELLRYGAKIITIGSEYSLTDLESFARRRGKDVSYYWSNFGGVDEDTQRLVSERVSEVRGKKDQDSVLKEIDGTLLLDKLLPLAIETSNTPIISRVEKGEYEDLKRDIKKNIPELDNENRIIGIVCREGNTSMLISTLLNQLGFTNVCSVQGGSRSLRIEKGANNASAEYCPVPGASITRSSIDFVKKLVLDNPEEYFTFMQYENDENLYAHLKTTGPELEEQVKSLDYVVCTFGTGGTATGIAKYFKEKKVVVAFPQRPVEGIRTLGGVEGLTFYKPELYARVLELGTGRVEAILEHFARSGLRFGPSTAIGLLAAIEIAKTEQDKTFVIIAADNLDNYVSEYRHLF